MSTLRRILPAELLTELDARNTPDVLLHRQDPPVITWSEVGSEGSISPRGLAWYVIRITAPHVGTMELRVTRQYAQAILDETFKDVAYHQGYLWLVGDNKVQSTL